MQNTILSSMALQSKPYFDTNYTLDSTFALFEDPNVLWEAAEENHFDTKEIAVMASSIIDLFVRKNLNPYYGYYPVVILNEQGIHSGIFLDLEIQHILSVDPSTKFFLPNQLLEPIKQ